MADENLARFRADVLRGLALPRKTIPSKYFYDAAGAALFDRICELDEYYPTRTEVELTRCHAGEIAELLSPARLLLEYGSGSSLKTRLLLDRLPADTMYVPIDLSSEYLQQSTAALAERYPHLEILPMEADFTRLIGLPAEADRARQRAVYFPGSTIGNFTPDEAVELLRRTARLCGAGGRLLLGADLKKDPQVLHAAYNDRLGVTAAFNLNLLARINRDLGADFRLEQFEHYAFYHPTAGRIEMHLVSRIDQHVRIGSNDFAFVEGESICTEYSYKYSLADLHRLAVAGGFTMERVWTDARDYFALLYLAVV